MRLKLVDLYALHMRKCLFSGYLTFLHKKLPFFGFADGTHMFVKENEAKTIRSFRPTFSDTGHFMHPRQDVAQ